MPITISVVVPVFGDGEMLDELTRRVSAVLDRQAGIPGLGWELILVNDGSPAATWDKISALASTRPNVRGINLLRNFGQHNALLAGLQAAKGEVIVTMDDDLQHPPEEIPRLISALDTNDVVYGTPIGRVRSWSRDLAATVSKAALASVLGTAHAQHIAAFRVFRGTLRRVFSEHNSPYVSIDVLLSWATTRIGAMPVAYHPRRHGRSGYTMWRLATLTINMVIGFSVWPLRFASVVGLGCAAFGAFVLMFVLGRYLTAGTTVPGFPFLASVIAIFSGAQLFSLGIIGEYLARMYFRTMDRPPYIIESTTDADATSPQRL